MEFASHPQRFKDVDLAEACAQIELMQGQVASLEKQVAERDVTIRAMELTLLLRAFEIARLKRYLFGDRSERVVPGDGTATLPGLDLDLPPSNDAPNGEAPGRTRRIREHDRTLGGTTKRPPLELDPACVDDKHDHVYPDAIVCACCGETMVDIGEETCAVVERQPARYRRTTTHRHKFACNLCKRGGVVIARPEDPPASGAGPVGTSLAVDIVLMHYADHLPFHRMTGIFGREGLRIDRSTLSRVAGRVARMLTPLVECMESELLHSDDVIGIDGTTIKILASPHCERKMVYVLHGQGHVVYRVLEAATAVNVLRGFDLFHGVAVADAASVHTGRVSMGMRLAVGLCNAHARRQFYDVRETDKARTEHVIRFYRQVAFFERSWADLDPEARQAQRHAVLAPRFEALQSWATLQLPMVMPRTPIRTALDYLLNHWNGLTLFLQDGRIPWTNNASERLLRHVAVGRSAWVFRGSFEGAVHACVLWSLMQSCRTLGIEPRRYLIDTLEALATTPHQQVATLTPRAYAARLRAALAVA